MATCGVGRLLWRMSSTVTAGTGRARGRDGVRGVQEVEAVGTVAVRGRGEAGDVGNASCLCVFCGRRPCRL